MIDAIIHQVAPIDAHDLLVKSGGMSQILLWTSFAEIFGGIALFQTIQGKRAPGDYKFDPLGLSQVRQPEGMRLKSGVGVGEMFGNDRCRSFGDVEKFCRLQGANEKNFERYQLAEIKHSRLAMIAFSGFVHQVRVHQSSACRGGLGLKYHAS
jgi:hypothetical protein